MRAPMMMPWLVSQGVKAAMAPTLLVLNVQAAYWQTWHDVWRGGYGR